MSYCSALYNHVYSDAEGFYKFCCYSKVSPIHSTKMTPFEWLSSNYIESARIKMLQGEKIPECAKCWNLEKNNHQSFRQTRFKSDSAKQLDVNHVEMKLRVFGNFCNLACYMCAPNNSSTREKQLQKTSFFERYNRGGEDYDFTLEECEKIIQDVIDNIEFVSKITFTGGEPLQLPRHHLFLEQIPDEYAKNITLVYQTNLTDLNHKGSFLGRVERFKSVSFNISCDHYGEKLAYIRYPINVKKFENNLEIIAQSSHDAQISITASILNIEDIDEIIEYYQNNFGIKTVVGSAVEWPSDLCIKNHPNKNKIPYHTDFVQSLLDMPCNKDEWNSAMDYLYELDESRGTNFKQLWPNYEKYS